MRLLVCGGRHFSDEKWLGAHLSAIHAAHPDLVIACGYDPKDERKQGADQIAYEWAKAHSVHGSVFPAHWDDLDAPGAVVVTPSYKGGRPYNRKAGPDRNQRMLDVFKPDRVLAAPGDAGTADMCRRARKAGVPVDEIGGDCGPRCTYQTPYYGRCRHPQEQGEHCLKHADTKCDGCDAPATHGCDGWVGSFVCCLPLCDTCIGDHAEAIFPMKPGHRPRTGADPTYAPWWKCEEVAAA